MSVEFKKFGVVGAGPVGSIVAAFLAKGGYDVTLCDVAAPLVEAAQDPGITIEGAENLHQRIPKILKSVDDFAQDPPEVIFITVKATALPLISSALQGFWREGMYAVSWQNGIDTELVLAQSLGRKAVMRAVVNLGCNMGEPGKIRMAFHHPPHYIQELDNASRDAAGGIAAALTKAGLPTEHTTQIVNMVWRKSIMNAALNATCAVSGMNMAQAMRDLFIFQLVDNMLKEGIQVARANEISLGWDYYRYCIDYLRTSGEHKPSMLIDIEAKRRTEVDFINGKIVEYGEQAGVDTPYNRTLRGLVKALEPK